MTASYLHLPRFIQHTLGIEHGTDVCGGVCDVSGVVGVSQVHTHTSDGKLCSILTLLDENVTQQGSSAILFANNSQ